MKNSKTTILNKLAEARSRNKNQNKRISIEIITDIAQLNRLVESRYKGKDLLNIASSSSDIQVLKKKSKKVQIDSSFQDSSQDLRSIVSKAKSRSKDHRNIPSRTSLFNDLKGTRSKGQKRKSNVSYFSKKDKAIENCSRFYSYDEIVTDRTLSKSKSGNEQKSTVVRSIKRTSKNLNDKFRSFSMILPQRKNSWHRTELEIDAKIEISE